MKNLEKQVPNSGQEKQKTKKQINKKKQPKETQTKQSKTKEKREKKWECEKVKVPYQPTPFFQMIFHM